MIDWVGLGWMGRQGLSFLGMGERVEEDVPGYGNWGWVPAVMPDPCPVHWTVQSSQRLFQSAWSCVIEIVGTALSKPMGAAVVLSAVWVNVTLCPMVVWQQP